MNIKLENRDAFFSEYPDFTAGVTSGKVSDRNKTGTKPVKIRKTVYNELKELWEAINQRYLLLYDRDLDDVLTDTIEQLLDEGVFSDVTMSSRRDEVASDGEHMTLMTGTGVQYTIERPIPYNEFLKRIA
jgi:type III restriction enzyme